MFGLNGGWSSAFQHMERSMSWTVQGYMGMGVVIQQNDTPCDHAGMLSLDGGMKISKGSTIALYIVGDVMVLECQHQWSIDVEENSPVRMDSALVTVAFNHVPLFLFALKCLFCCTACG
jgi:hypothetical protein